MLALCCDYRLQTTKGTFGLNEVALGITVPKYWGERFLEVCNKSADGERLLQLGTLLMPKEALRVGLIDELCDDRQSLEKRAHEVATKMASVPMNARAATKRNVRGNLADAWAAYGAQEAAEGWQMLEKPEIVAQLRGVLESLRKSKL